jgi:hypothetical protein
MRYDPAVSPDSREWLELDEGERIVAVRQYHKKARLRSGNAEAHAIIHAAVETQLAKGHPDAQAAYSRLSREGLDRHDVVHAIGSVVALEFYDIVKAGGVHDAAEYARRLRELTAEKWLRGPQE